MPKSSVLSSLLIALVALAASPAHAYLITVSGGTTTSTAGAVTFADFDTPVTVDPAYATITGGTLNLGTNPGGGGNWLCAQGGFSCGVVTINFTGMENYFGLLWGSQDDTQNTVRLFNGATLVGTVTAPAAGGNVSSFVNITAATAAEYFDRIELTTSTGVGFEVDNLAVREAPEPLTGALLGLGLAGLAWSRRRKV